MAAGSCRCYQGLIYMGVHRGAHPCWPWSTGLQGGGGGGAKNQIQKYGIISKVFPFLKSN
jgi:hypothetical protein